VKVVYSAPNRAHHYGYAQELHAANMLEAFVCGFSRFSPRAPIPEIGEALKRVDQVQTAYIASQKLRMPRWISEELAHWAKIQIDRASCRNLQGADMFLFYNGCGLDSAREFRRDGGITIVEAVNSHVLAQEKLLAEEYKALNLSWHPFHRREVKRRVAEVEETDYVLLPSRFVARSFLAQGIPAERLLRVPYPMHRIAGASMTAKHDKKNDDGVFRILYVGSISLRKGLRYLIEAFRRFSHPRKELWIVGPLAKPSGLENVTIPAGTKFFGPLKGNDLQEKYLRATVFCLPSLEEGLALVLSEALSHGLPVIATENTGIEDLLTEGKTGMVVPIRDAGAIHAHLAKLAGDQGYLQTKNSEALEWASNISGNTHTKVSLSSTLWETYCEHRKERSGNHEHRAVSC
jgi:glycosyltransferase involved in cell wall biosynthesis